MQIFPERLSSVIKMDLFKYYNKFKILPINVYDIIGLIIYSPWKLPSFSHSHGIKYESKLKISYIRSG